MGLDAVELMMDVEELFDIVIPNPVPEQIATVGGFTDWVTDRLRAEGRPIPRDEVRARIVAIVQMLVAVPDPLEDWMSFVGDLGMG